jgi:hypothetical protein
MRSAAAGHGGQGSLCHQAGPMTRHGRRRHTVEVPSKRSRTAQVVFGVILKRSVDVVVVGSWERSPKPQTEAIQEVTTSRASEVVESDQQVYDPVLACMHEPERHIDGGRRAGDGKGWLFGASLGGLSAWRQAKQAPDYVGARKCNRHKVRTHCWSIVVHDPAKREYGARGKVVVGRDAGGKTNRRGGSARQGLGSERDD